MDALDVKILRALLSERSVAPSERQVSSSLRSIAARLGADDVTVTYRYKKLAELGALSGWRIAINPTFFGLNSLDATVDVQPESAKPDMIRKLSLIHEVVGIQDFYGRGLKVVAWYGSNEARSRVVELISRITNPESMTVFHWTIPKSRTERLTPTDVAIIRALSDDARMSLSEVARELGFSTRTVRNHVEKLLSENLIHSFPSLNMSSIPGLIPVHFSYTYSNGESKGAVDGAILSRFEENYLSVMFSDPDRGYITMVVSTMKDVQDALVWAKSQPGIASARTDILVKWLTFPDKLVELLDLKNMAGPIQDSKVGKTARRK